MQILFLGISNAQVKPIAIGEKVPNISFNYTVGNVPKKGSIADYKGKTILIDFWATWCSPCVSSLTFLDSLQKKYGDKLQVLCVTREGGKVVKEVISKIFHDHEPAFSIILKDSVMENYFPHQTIPHCVWIDKNGIVKAITDKSEVTSSNITRLIDEDSLQIINKPQTIKYDIDKPPYASQQVNLKNEFLYHSLITKYREDLETGYSRGINNDFISCINSPIIRLYQCAFGKFDLAYWDMNKVICRGFTTFADSAKLGIFTSDRLIHEWQNNIRSDAYSYELATRDTIFSNRQLFQIMQEDLNRYFASIGIEAHLERKEVNALALTQIDSIKTYRNYKGGNSHHYSTPASLKVENEPISFFITQLQPYIQKKNNMAIVNDTGYDGNVDIELNKKTETLSGLNEELKKIGLRFIEKKTWSNVIVVTKNPPSKSPRLN